MGDRELLEQCKCSLRIRLVGDGCQACNPEFWRKFFERQDADDAAEAAAAIGAKGEM